MKPFTLSVCVCVFICAYIDWKQQKIWISTESHDTIEVYKNVCLNVRFDAMRLWIWISDYNGMRVWVTHNVFITNKIVIIIKFGFRKSQNVHTHTHTLAQSLIHCVVAFSPIAKPQIESKQNKKWTKFDGISHGTGIGSGSTFIIYFFFQLCLRSYRTVKRTHKMYAYKKKHGY